jgi:uncharacterized surface protein with fasciclin (FAS1) repeats
MSLARLVLLLRPVGLVSLSAVLSATIVITAAVPAAAAAESADIVDTAVGAGQFTTLAKALQAAGLVETLKGPGPFTVFAPTDAAFAKLPAGTLDALLANPASLKAVLTYHVVSGEVPASQVIDLKSATTVEGEPISIAVSGGGVVLNGTTNVPKTDIMASNGIIHVIDSVLVPPSIATAMQAAPTSAGRQMARDGQSLATQTPATQALFMAVWGSNAPAEWLTEHEAELARSGR